MSAAPQLERGSVARKLKLIELERLLKEQARRKRRKLALVDLKYLAQRLIPDNVREFWGRFGEPQEWVLQLFLAAKHRAGLELLPGVELIVEGKKRIIERPEVIDLSEFSTYMLRMSRETLKSNLARVSMVHDLIWYPEVKGENAVVVYTHHKLDMTKAAKVSVAEWMCEPSFAEDWPDIVPKDRKSDRWGTVDTLKTRRHVKGSPEPSMFFAAAGQSYTGGRAKTMYLDDIVTEDDQFSPTEREDSRRVIVQREQQRDKTQGLVFITGTDYHSDDAYQTTQRKQGIVTFKLPCLRGDYKLFMDFASKPLPVRRSQVQWFTERCKPVFTSLDLLTLAESFNKTNKLEFATQMMLDPAQGGMNVFQQDEIPLVSLDSVPEGLPAYGFLDSAFKRSENKLKGDFNALGVVVFDKHGRKILVDGAYRNDWGESEVFTEMASLIRRWKILNWFGEDKDMFESWTRFALRNGVPLITMSPLTEAGRQNKMQRIKGLEPEFRAGRIVLVRDIPITTAVLAEALDYDAIGGSPHDDALDMLAQCQDSAVGEPLWLTLNNESGSDTTEFVLEMP